MSRVRPSEAPRQRSPRQRSKSYLGYIAALGQGHGCVICGASPCEVAHVRYTEPCPMCDGAGRFPGEPRCLNCKATGYVYGKRPTGMGEKPDDIWTLPLCPEHHRMGKEAQHASNERDWWAKHGIDPLALCHALQQAYPSIEEGVKVLANQRRDDDD